MEYNKTIRIAVLSLFATAAVSCNKNDKQSEHETAISVTTEEAEWSLAMTCLS